MHPCSKKYLLWLLVFACISVISCDVFKKGRLYGDVVVTITFRPSVLSEEETKVFRIAGREIDLLKYSDTLPPRHTELEAECSRVYNDIAKQREQKISEATRLVGSYGVTDPDSITNLAKVHIRPIEEEYSEKETSAIRECANKRNAMLFEHIVKKVTTDTQGHYEFTDLSYGRYFLSVEWGVRWWLVPVQVDAGEIKIDLTEKNAYLISS
ncbi:MAG: hypothetical protein ABSC55_16975 [Syntrophorhabdales bacterium]|jgi:hypothetical protein